MILPSRLTMLLGGATALLLPLCIVASWNWGVSHRGMVAQKKLAQGYYAEIYTETTGYRDRLTVCQANTKGLMEGLSVQNQAVERLEKEANALQASADARVAAARAQTRAAEAARQSLLRAQPKEGEAECDAAFRLHQETLS